MFHLLLEVLPVFATWRFINITGVNKKHENEINQDA
jgi:hypothetical protein